MPMGLKNAAAEFQNIMNNIISPYNELIVVYLDDVLVFSESWDKHIKHLNIFKRIIKQNGLVLSDKKMNLAQTKIRFLGHEIYKGKITPIARSIKFASRFPNKINDKNQL